MPISPSARRWRRPDSISSSPVNLRPSTLTKWVDDFDRSGQIGTHSVILTRSHGKPKGKRIPKVVRERWSFRFMADRPLRDADDAILANWFELTVTDEETGKANFGHGKRQLSNLLDSMNILAFLVHMAFEFRDTPLMGPLRKPGPSHRRHVPKLRVDTV